MSAASSSPLSYYAILGVPKDASATDIKKGYRTMALKLHPDHNNSPTAKEDFQQLTKVYQVLCDENKRRMYDKHGAFEEDDSETFDESYAYWRNVFPEITVKDIDEFEKTYVGSAMEDEDIIANFTKYKGDMNRVVQCVPYAASSSADRLCERVESLINVGQLPCAPAIRRKFKSTSKGLSKRMASEESAEAEEAMEAAREKGLALESDLNSDGLPSSLVAMIKSKQQSASTFLDSLSAKYAESSPRKKAKKGSKKPAEPSEEEFVKLQQRLFSKKKKT